MQPWTETHMHEEHLLWQREHSSWLKDVEAWGSICQSAEQRLDTIRGLFCDRQSLLRAHALAISGLSAVPDQHEFALAEAEQGGPPDMAESLEPKHRAQGDRQRNCRAAHARLANSMNSIEKLLTRLESALIPKAPHFS